jgi:hypothetical protein
MSSELKKIRRKCIEQGKTYHSCKGCDMLLPNSCRLGSPATWNIEKIRTWLNKGDRHAKKSNNC